jgi:lipopolysaccharide export system protein LptC
LTTTSQAEERGGYVFNRTNRADRRRVFRAARRHSRMVRALRFMIPAAVVLGLSAFMLEATVLDPLRAIARLPVKIGGLAVSGAKITMVQPRFAGYTQDARPYVVTARQAAQDITNPDRIELDDIRATMDSDTGTVELLARSGLFETKAERLTLQQQIVISAPAYRIRLTEAVVDVRTGHIVSERPVDVMAIQGTLNASRLEILNSGDVIRFEHGVTMVLNAEHADADPKGNSQ